MAYASLVSLQHTTHLFLNYHKYSISVDETQHIKSIHEHVIFLISFLENSPEKANSLEGKIRDLSNEAENLIEHFMWSQFQMDLSDGLSRVEFESQLKRVTEEIGEITGEMMGDGLCCSPVAISSSRVAAAGKNDLVMGLDEDLIAIKGRLCGESSKLEVIPIVGMGGIGKTTLARYAYDDPLIMECFHIRAFVQVSQDYSAKELISNLLASVKLLEENEYGIAENMCNESEIAESVYKRLKGRRYLIVLDDIWSTRAWNDMRNIFPDDKNGSRIMLTTRLSHVAAYVSLGSPLHEMKFMDGNQSWNLLREKLVTNGHVCPPELEDIGKAIARGCRGLPLAVVLVAGILPTVVETRASWEEIAKNVNSVVQGKVDNVLSLSYTLLPHHLRACFLSMAGYPEDHNIHVSRLIKLWVAEGFLKHENGSKSLEDEAEEYVEDLVKRSLVLVTSRKSNGKIKSCSLHDLVRDMCMEKARKEKFLMHVKGSSVIRRRRKDVRRIVLSRLDGIQSPTIHTILCFEHCSSMPFLVNLRLLRVLDIINYHHVMLPPEVFELFHLRYLAVGLTNKIPSAISNLENLQTLIICPRIKLRGCSHGTYRSYLPQEIWKMKHLRHLLLPARRYRLPIPADGPTLPLENLQTLSDIASSICSEKILKMIPNLKKLGIFCFRDQEIDQLHDLVNLHQLKKLKITIFSWQGRNPAFPRMLNRLSLVGGKLPWKDMTIIGSLPNLEVLKLKNYACDGDTWETANEFPQLKFLLIDRSYLQYWITENGNFPRLKCLMLHRCPSLKEIPNSIGEIPTLEVIAVDTLNKSLLNSAKEIQEEQRSYGNDALRVRRIH